MLREFTENNIDKINEAIEANGETDAYDKQLIERKVSNLENSIEKNLKEFKIYTISTEIPSEKGDDHFAKAMKGYCKEFEKAHKERNWLEIDTKKTYTYR